MANYSKRGGVFEHSGTFSDTNRTQSVWITCTERARQGSTLPGRLRRLCCATRQWTPYNAQDLTYDGTYASFTATGFSGYAVTVPEPGTLVLLAAGLLILSGEGGSEVGWGQSRAERRVSSAPLVHARFFAALRMTNRP